MHFMKPYFAYILFLTDLKKESDHQVDAYTEVICKVRTLRASRRFVKIPLKRQNFEAVTALPVFM